MDRGVWQVTVHRVANSPTGLSDWHYRKQSTAQKTIPPVAETWDHPKRVLLFPGGSLSEGCSVVSDQKLSGSSVHGIHQARLLQWVAILFSGEPSPGTEPGSTTLKAGSLSHQGNSNQQKEKRKKAIASITRPGFRSWVVKNLSGFFAQLCLIGHPVFTWKSPLWLYGYWVSLVSQLEKNSPTVRETCVPSLG